MRHYLILIAILFLSACKNKHYETYPSNNYLPNLICIDSMKETEFVPTLESNFHIGMNTVYSPTLVLAWNEIRNKTGELTSTNNAIQTLNKSTSFENAIEKNEFHSETKIEKGNIIAKVDFNLELSFDPFLEKTDLIFCHNNKLVSAFGMKKYNPEILKKFEIIYFQDNNNFIFKLMPKQVDNEIIFIKGLNTLNVKNINDILKTLANYQKIGDAEKQIEEKSWKYILKEEETFVIPDIEFNIYKSYEEIINNRVTSASEKYNISKASQRIGILLNNEGAKIESDATLEMTKAKVNVAEIEIEKNLLLDKPFFAIFKHPSKMNPYLVLKIETEELLKSLNF